MSVSMGIRDKKTNKYSVVPIATQQTFYESWVPLCAKMGLSLVPEMATCVLTCVNDQAREQLIRELELLIPGAEQDGLARVSERAQNVLLALRSYSLDEYEIDFG